MDKSLPKVLTIYALGIFAIVVGGFLLTMAVIEGDKEVFRGKAFHFEIGMSKEECFGVIKNKYSSPYDLLHIEWRKANSYGDSLARFENTVFARRTQDFNGYYEIKVDEADSIEIPMRYVNIWEIRKTDAFIDHVRLEFQGGALAKIARSRWLFERP